MLIRALADQHGIFPKVEPCDVLLIAGDVCPMDSHQENHQRAWLRNQFSEWLNELPAERIIGIAGNHDFALQKYKGLGDELPWEYLEDSSLDLDGLKVYGSPWVPNLPAWAFYGDAPTLREKVDAIPDDVDILITHGPPDGILDRVLYGINVGSSALASALRYRIKPRLHVFGHIHESHGREKLEGDDHNVIFANVSIVDENYTERHKPMEFEISVP